MKNDIRYCEFKFLCALAKRVPMFEYANINNQQQQEFLGLGQMDYIEMLILLAEEGNIVLDDYHYQILIGRLRGEVSPSFPRPTQIAEHSWQYPRDHIHNRLICGNLARPRITYSGKRRIEELRDLLKRDRILEPMGVLLDLRYYHADLEDALRRSAEIPISVLRLDMDNFKRINDNFGHAAGDVVMKAYLQTVKECLGNFGDAYRGRGDEVAAIIIGQPFEKVCEFAEKIRSSVESLKCKYKDADLLGVTTSAGLATSPPADRDLNLETLADSRQKKAKEKGKNCVVSF